MAQHDYIIDNQPGASFRADLNSALAATVSNNSGAAAPATTYPFQWWADTTASILKQRDATNSLWTDVLDLRTGRPIQGVAQTSSTGAALMPEGDNSERPGASGLVGVLAIRGSTQNPADYFAEYWDPVLADWTPLASRAYADSAASTTFSSQAENIAGVVTNKAVSPKGVREAFNAAGSAPVYACRAWVNFNGTGTVAIRASGNVTSITDHGTGDFTMNFTTPMQDTNYAVIITCGASGSVIGLTRGDVTPRTTGSVRFSTNATNTTATADASENQIAVFR